MAQMVEIAPISVDVQKPINNFKEMRKAIRDLRGELLGLERGTAEYNDALRRMGEAQDHMNDVMEDSRAAANMQDLADVTASVAHIGQTVTAGFQAYQSVVALTGVQNEALEKTFVKLQASMALTQSLGAMANGIKAAAAAMRAFNATMLSNPYIAIGVAIAAVVAGLAALVSQLARNRQAEKEYVATLEETKNAEIGLSREQDRRIRIMQAVGATSAEVSQQQVEDANLNMKNAEEKYYELVSLANKATSWWRKFWGADLKDDVKKGLDDQWQVFLDAQKERDTALQNAEVNRAKEQKQAEEKAREQAQRYAEQRKKDFAEAWKVMQDAEKAGQDELDRIRKEKEEARANMFETSRAAAFTEEPVQDNVPTIQAMYDTEYTLLLGQLERKELALEDFNVSAAKLDLKYSQTAKQQAEARIKIGEAERKAKDAQLGMISDALGAFSQLVGEQTVAGKALATAEAVINTYRAANVALASGPPPWNFIQAAVTVAAGLANVNAILSTKVPGASDTTSATAVATPNVGAVYQAPIKDTRSVLTSTEEQQLQQNNRVYVVESDIRQTGSKVEIAENEATFN